MSTPPKPRPCSWSGGCRLPSMSASNAAPARANMSPSPVASTATFARIAWRPACSRRSRRRSASPSTIGRDRPGVEDEPSTPARAPCPGRQLQPLRPDGRRPGDDAVEGGGALPPTRRPWPRPSIPRLPSAGRRRASFGMRSSRSLGQAPDHQPPAQSVMRSIHMTSPPVESPPRCVCRSTSVMRRRVARRRRQRPAGRATAHHQHVGFGKHRDVARGLVDLSAPAAARTGRALSHEDLLEALGVKKPLPPPLSRHTSPCASAQPRAPKYGSALAVPGGRHGYLLSPLCDKLQ